MKAGLTPYGELFNNVEEVTQLKIESAFKWE